MANMSESEIQQIKDLIEGIHSAMMTTTHGQGLRSRPMAPQTSEFDGSLWFMAQRTSEKIAEIRSDSAVNVAFSDPGKNRYVSISGKAFLTDDREKIKELWSPLDKVWFSGPEDPEIMLIRVDVDGAEYWDGPSNKMVALYGWVKSLITGNDANLAKNETLGGAASAM